MIVGIIRIVKTIYFVILAGLLLTPSLSAKVYLITNAANKQKTIDKTQIKQIFLGQKTRWKNGNKIQLVDNLNKKAARKFYQETTGRGTGRIKKEWIGRMLRGEMIPPESFRDEEELIDFISRNKNAIGFVTSPQSNKGIKVLHSFDL